MASQVSTGAAVAVGEVVGVTPQFVHPVAATKHATAGVPSAQLLTQLPATQYGEPQFTIGAILHSPPFPVGATTTVFATQDPLNISLSKEQQYIVAPEVVRH